MKIKKIEYHRNGVSGTGFHVVSFTQKNEKDKRRKQEMIAVIFPEKGNIAVFDLNLLGKGVIEFGENSWRGDEYESELRKHLPSDE